MKTNQNQSGSAHIVLIVILVLAIVGGFGYVAYAKFFAPKAAEPVAQTTTETEAAPCENEGDAVETNNVFCSEEIGIKLQIPTSLKGSFVKADNYEIFKGSVDYNDRASDGNADLVYVLDEPGEYGFKVTIAKEKLRSGYVDVTSYLSPTFYSEDTGLLSNIISPENVYNSVTQTTTQSGEYAVGETVPSFKVGETTFYHGTAGDAGVTMADYFAVINGSIVKIKIFSSAYMGMTESEPTGLRTDDEENKLYDDLDAAIKNIVILK